MKLNDFMPSIKVDPENYVGFFFFGSQTQLSNTHFYGSLLTIDGLNFRLLRPITKFVELNRQRICH